MLCCENLYKQYSFLSMPHLEEYEEYNIKCYKYILCVHNAGESADSQAVWIWIEFVRETVKLFKTTGEY